MEENVLGIALMATANPRTLQRQRVRHPKDLFASALSAFSRTQSGPDRLGLSQQFSLHGF
jgi:hypothetical protein